MLCFQRVVVPPCAVIVSMVYIKFFMNGCFVYKYKVVYVSFFWESDLENIFRPAK